MDADQLASGSGPAPESGEIRANNGTFQQALNTMYDAYLVLRSEDDAQKGKTSPEKAVVILSPHPPHVMAKHLGVLNVVSFTQAFANDHGDEGKFVWDKRRFQLACTKGSTLTLFKCDGLHTRIVDLGFEIKLIHFIKLMIMSIPSCDDTEYTVARLLQLNKNPLPINALAADYACPAGTWLAYRGTHIYRPYNDEMTAIYELYRTGNCACIQKINNDTSLESVSGILEDWAGGNIPDRNQVCSVIREVTTVTGMGFARANDPAFHFMTCMAATGQGLAVRATLQTGGQQVLAYLAAHASGCKILQYGYDMPYKNSAFVVMTHSDEWVQSLVAELKSTHGKPLAKLVDPWGVKCLEPVTHDVLVDKHQALLDDIHGRLEQPHPTDASCRVWMEIVMPQFTFDIATALSELGRASHEHVTHTTFELDRGMFSYIINRDDLVTIKSRIRALLQASRTMTKSMLQDFMFAGRCMTAKDLTQMRDYLQPPDAISAQFPCREFWDPIPIAAERNTIRLCKAVLADLLSMFAAVPDESLQEWRAANGFEGVIERFIDGGDLPLIEDKDAVPGPPENPSLDQSVSGLDLQRGQAGAQPAPPAPPSGTSKQPAAAAPAPPPAGNGARPDAPEHGLAQASDKPYLLEGRPIPTCQRQFKELATHAHLAASVTKHDFERWTEESWFGDACADITTDNEEYLKHLYSQIIGKAYIPRIDPRTRKPEPTELAFAARTPGLLNLKHSTRLAARDRFAPGTDGWQAAFTDAECEAIQDMIKAEMREFANPEASTDEEGSGEGAGDDEEERPQDEAAPLARRGKAPLAPKAGAAPRAASPPAPKSRGVAGRGARAAPRGKAAAGRGVRPAPEPPAGRGAPPAKARGRGRGAKRRGA